MAVEARPPGTNGMAIPTLEAWGWSPEREASFADHAAAGLIQGRAFAQSRDSTRAMTVAGPTDVVIQRGFRRATAAAGDFPAVGDWLALEPFADGSGAALRAVLPRTTAFSRGQADGNGRLSEQVLASNIDTLFLVSALTGDFNIRRLERYLTLAWASGAEPVVLLNKSDLTRDVEARIAEASAVAGNAAIHALSARNGTGLEMLHRYLSLGRTVALLGSSGVGKSTIANALLGEERQQVRAVREDDHRGRHTTTGRELFPLPSGALLLDTPGLRRINLWDNDDGMHTGFADIEDLAARCRFADCRHETEPGCAVTAAIAAGELARDRLNSQRKLEREFRSYERRSSVAASRAEGRRWGRMVRNACRDQSRITGREY